MKKTKNIFEEKLIWNLDDILPESKFYELSQSVEKYINLMSKKIKRLNPKMDGESFAEIIKLEENHNENLAKLIYLPYLRESVNQKDQEARLLKSKAEDLLLKTDEINQKLFHWIKGKKVLNLPILDEANANRLFESVPD